MNAIITPRAEVGLVTAQIESDPVTFIDTIFPMLPEHYRELSVHKAHGFELHPELETYRQRAARGELLAASLRESGAIVGYFFGFIGPALHYVDCLTLSMDIMYVAKRARGSKGRVHGVAALFDCVEAEARRRGVHQIRVGGKIHRGRHTADLYQRGAISQKRFTGQSGMRCRHDVRRRRDYGSGRHRRRGNRRLGRPSAANARRTHRIRRPTPRWRCSTRPRRISRPTSISATTP